jgi:hypothetical protein
VADSDNTRDPLVVLEHLAENLIEQQHYFYNAGRVDQGELLASVSFAVMQTIAQIKESRENG